MDRKNIDLDPLYSALDMPFEFLKDPSYWLEADKMEALLEEAQKIYYSKYPEKESFIESLAQNSAELRSWGVLDGVLRMLQKPQDIFSKPERFISYFISPSPPIANVLREDNAISFMLPISQREYPLSLSYIKSIMETLPTFAGKNPFQVSWQANTVFISWEGQEALFAEDPGHIMKPELMESLAASLEKSQKDLESKNRELKLKNMELERAKMALEKTLSDSKKEPELEKPDITAPLSYMQTNLHRMQDYMARAQQLITLLVGQGRADKQVKEAMRRVDWNYVLKNYPQLMNEIYASIDSLREKAEGEVETMDENNKKLDLQNKKESQDTFKLDLQ